MTNIHDLMATNDSKTNGNPKPKPKKLSPARGKMPPLVGGGIGGRAPLQTVFRLSDCSAQYADTLADPFESPSGACVPIIPAFPSRKAVYFIRGALQTSSTTGIGYVYCGPNCASDVSSLWYSTSTYAGSVLANTGTGVSAGQLNSDYTSASFSAQALQWRPVACGVRVRYTGTELNRGGTVYAIEQPDHIDLSGSTITDLLKYDACHRFAVDRSWTDVCWAPVSMSDTDYTNGNTPIGVLALMIQAPSATTSISFDFEMFIHVELIGRAARGKSPSHSDETGFGTVLGAVREHNEGQIDRAAVFHEGKRRPLSKHKGFLQVLGDYAKKTVSGFLEKAPGLIKEAGPILAAAAPMLL